MEDCLPSRCSETKAAVISGRAASGPSSPDAISGPSSPDAHYSDTFTRLGPQFRVEGNSEGLE